MLAHHPLVQRIFHLQQLVALALDQLGDRDAGPARHDLRDFFLGDRRAQQALGLVRLRLFLGVGGAQLLLQFRNLAVLELGHARQIAAAARRFQRLAAALQRFLDAAGALHLCLFGTPALFQVAVLAFQFGDFLLQLLAPAFGGLVLLDGLALDLQLDQAPLQAVQRLGLGVDLDADAAGGLVHQVDGLVRQLAVADVAVREPRRGDDRRIADVHAVVHFVAFLEAAQDRDAVFH